MSEQIDVSLQKISIANQMCDNMDLHNNDAAANDAADGHMIPMC